MFINYHIYYLLTQLFDLSVIVFSAGTTLILLGENEYPRRWWVSL